MRLGTKGRVRLSAVSAMVVLAATGLVAAACAPLPPAPVPPPEHSGGFDPDTAIDPNTAAYAAPGPFAVGVMTVEIDPGRFMEVWYPVDPEDTDGLETDKYYVRDYIAADLDRLLAPSVNPEFDTGAFRDVDPLPGSDRPMVLFSHGFMGFRTQSTRLTTHLASWGMVVASPDYFERGLQSFGGAAPAATRTPAQVTQLVVDKLVELNSAGPLAGQINTSELFPIGHSAGGSQSTALAGDRVDVHSWIALASGVNVTPSPLTPNPRVPAALKDPDKTVMWLAGENDGVAQLSGIRDAYTHTAGEKKLVVIPGAGHNNAFSDLCEIGKDQGGLIGLAMSGGLPLPDFVINLARDGCVSPPNHPSAEVWPVAHHFVTAELRYRSGLDPEPVGLGSSVVAEFPAVGPIYSHAE